MWSRCLPQLCNDLLNRCILYIMQCNTACRFILPCSQRGDQICYKITILHVSSVHSVCVCVCVCVSVSRNLTDQRTRAFIVNASLKLCWTVCLWGFFCFFVGFFLLVSLKLPPRLPCTVWTVWKRFSVIYLWNMKWRGVSGLSWGCFIRVYIQLQLLNTCSCSLVSSVGERWSHFPLCSRCCRPVRLSRPVRCCLLLPYFVLTFHIPAVTCISS